MNELLRRMLLQAHLRQDDVAARLGVDPKTVTRWLNGRVPHPNNRAAIADLLDAEETDLWPAASGTVTARVRPDELVAVYSRREAVPREVWVRLFASAEQEIGILAYSALFLAEDVGILRLLAHKGHAGVRVRIALADPASHSVADRREEDTDDAAPAMIRNALTRYESLGRRKNVEIRLHGVDLYNSIYRADSQVLINQHAYGIPAAQAPAFSLRDTETAEMTALYPDSFERVWACAIPRPGAPQKVRHE